MALNPSNSSKFEQLTLKGLTICIYLTIQDQLLVSCSVIKFAVD